jgi:hypothetical protein
MKTCIFLIPVIGSLLVGVANAQMPAPPDKPEIPQPGDPFHPRLKIVNQCTNPIWAIFTPGGNPSQVAALQNSGGWFRAYATQEKFTGTGATADAAVNTTTITIHTAPVDSVLYFHPGQFIMPVTSREISGGDFTNINTTMITEVSTDGTVLTVDPAVTVHPDMERKDGRSQIFVDLLKGAVQIPSGANNSMAFSNPRRWGTLRSIQFLFGMPEG